MRLRTLRLHGLPLLLALCVSSAAVPRTVAGQIVRCLPVAQRTAELGCWVTADQVIGTLPRGPVSWYLDTFPTRADARAAARPGATVVESLGKIWLLTVAETGWRPPQGFGSTRVTEVGPLPVTPGVRYATQYLEAVFQPGMKSIVHRHGGPEVWYTASGETCLETPNGKFVGRPGQPVIVPGGGPMELTATGTELRRAIVLILYDATGPASTPDSVWKPRGLCLR